PAWIRRPWPHEQVPEEGEGLRAVTRAADDDRLVPGRVPTGRDDGDLGQDLVLAVDPALLAPGLDEAQLGLDIRGDHARVLTQSDLPLRLLGDDRGMREGLRAIG